MKKGQICNYEEISNFANDNDYEVIEYGGNTIGENFIVLKHNDKDLTVSFMLEGGSSLGCSYECVYSDVK
ncbi:MAG TPA: hypothetical protein VIH28_07125 [Ignavibacteriaceae bacterium]